MKKILITGGAGYVGSVLTEKLLNKGYSVVVLDLFLYDENSLKHIENNSRLKIIRGDIRDNSIITDIMKDIDTIVHLAAISNDPTAELDESLTKSINYDSYYSIIEAAKKNGVKRFINASSSSVFGIKNEKNVTEDLEPEPITVYSKYKTLSEKLVNSASSKDFVTVNIRPATICGYSPRQRFDLTVNILTKSAIVDRKMTIHGGNQMRPNITMEDITDLYCLMLEIEPSLINGETFNYGFENLSILKIAELIKNTLSTKSEIEIVPVIDQRNYHISSQKIIDKLGIKPKYKIIDMVKQLESAFLAGKFSTPEDEKYYNIRKMKLSSFR